MITTLIAVGSLAVAIVSALIAALSVRYARRSSTATEKAAAEAKRSADAAEQAVTEAKRSATAAEQVLDLERQKLRAETEHTQFRSRVSGDAVYITQFGNGVAHAVTFTRNLHPINGTPATDWPKGHSETFVFVPAGIADIVTVPSVSWTDSSGNRQQQPIDV